MAFQRKLTPEQEKSLLRDHKDGWTIREISVIYKVSERTVYRILADYGVRLQNKRTRRQRRARKSKSRELKPCGTNAAYQRHRRKNEYPCVDCLKAHAQDVQEAKTKIRRKVVSVQIGTKIHEKIEESFENEEDHKKDNFRHIVNPPSNTHIWKPGMTAQDIVDIARVRGWSVIALCGAKFIPMKNPEDVKTTCQTCLDIASIMLANPPE